MSHRNIYKFVTSISLQVTWMSDSEVTAPEWKTIRISASSYYKLVELSGLITVLFGTQPFPISSVADLVIQQYYDAAYSRLKETVTNPDKLEQARKEIGGSLKRLFELWTKPKFE